MFPQNTESYMFFNLLIDCHCVLTYQLPKFLVDQIYNVKKSSAPKFTLIDLVPFNLKTYLNNFFLFKLSFTFCLMIPVPNNDDSKCDHILKWTS